MKSAQTPQAEDTATEDTGTEKTEAAAAQGSPDPLALWNRLKRTDPKFTKPFQRAGGFRGTQIDPTWRMQMMTELFGPVGKGWGYEQLEWTIAERMIFICARVWYRDPETGEQCWTGPQWGGTEMIRKNRDGSERPDDECFKMSMTDAVGKCLVQIGLGADIYLGQFEDSKYRDEVEAFYQAKANPDIQPLAIEKFEREIKEKLAAVTELEGLDELWRSGVNARLREIGLVDKATQSRIISYFSQKKNEILKREEGSRTDEARTDEARTVEDSAEAA
jgi:hypothetical protein